MIKTMNKLMVPSILVASVLLVGIFAFSPVNQASTVHDTITDEIGAQDRTITFNQLFGGNTGGLDITIPLTSLAENAYSGEVSMTAYCNEDDHDTFCDDVEFTIEVDTDNDGVFDTEVLFINITGGGLFGEDADDFPAGVDQIFISTDGLGNDEGNIVSISIVILLDGTET